MQFNAVISFLFTFAFPDITCIYVCTIIPALNFRRIDWVAGASILGLKDRSHADSAVSCPYDRLTLTKPVLQRVLDHQRRMVRGEGRIFELCLTSPSRSMSSSRIGARTHVNILAITAEFLSKFNNSQSKKEFKQFLIER